MMNGRVELHNESRYSENLSFLSANDIAQKAKNFSCAAVAVTDLNSVYTYAEAENALSKLNIPMIYGITLACADEEDRYNVVLLARNLAGRDNIFRLTELLHENYPLLGHAVTRKQLDLHREGTLIGSAAFNGQLVRAVLRRRNQRYLDAIAASCDYIEFTPEPYDCSAEIFRLAQTHKIPLCAVQHAVLSKEGGPAEYHAYRALNEYYLTDMAPAYWKPASELEEEIRTLYVLPREEGLARQAVLDAPQKIAAQIEPIPPVCRLSGLSPHYNTEASFGGAPQQNFLGSILCSMPLHGYEDLYRVMNLAYSAGAWWDSAKDRLEQGGIMPAQVITCREDILDYLTGRGCDRRMAFEIMEWVRKGRASSNHQDPPDAHFLPPQWEALRACGAEDWFIDSCSKIGYLFPRGHGAALSDCLARLVWYAIHYQKETEQALANI